VRHHRSDAYSAEQVFLNKRQIYGGAPKVNCYRDSYRGIFLQLFVYVYNILT